MYEHSSQAPGLLSQAASPCVCSPITYLIMMERSPAPFCLSSSMWAPDTSRMALMFDPPRPITRLTALEGTITFLERKLTGLKNRKKLRYGHMECTSGLIVTPTPFYGPRQWQPQCFTVHKGQVLTTVPCLLTFLGAAQYNDIILVVY